MASNYYPPVGFHFNVSFDAGIRKSESQFQSVSGLSVKMETEEFAEGGENRFKHTLPVKTTFTDLVLTRGLYVESELREWCKEAMEDFVFRPKDMTITLLNESHEPLMSWFVSNCYPIKWEVSDLNAEESKIVTETIGLSYNYFRVLT